MSKVVVMGVALASLLIAAIPARADDASDTAKLIGTWKMVSWSRHNVATGDDVKALGEHPSGYSIYTKDGHFSVHGFNDGRPKPAGADLTDAERLALFKTMYAYEGTYKVQGGKIILHVENAWNQGWVGTDHVLAKYDVTDKMLSVVTAPFKSVADGKEITVAVTLQRVE